MDHTDTAPAIPPVSAVSTTLLAPWWVRAAAFAVDVLPGTAVVAAMALAASTVPLYSVWWWSAVSVAVLAIVLTAGHRSALPAVTGWSLGRAVFGIAVVRDNGDPVGPWRLLIRDLAHLLDTAAVLLGWFWPLWDERRRTFADLLARTEVRRVPSHRRPRNMPALAAVVFLTAALLCIAGAAMTYAVVYQHQRAVDQARAQVASQGPKVVERMLTYKPESLREDFERAQSLVTDNYRDQLVTQQQAVEKGKPVANEYWVANSSVLAPVSPDRVTMLLFLQGKRGDEGKERLISATVRVTFAKLPGDRWLVDDVTVVTKPVPAGDGN
ncbi:MAG TPA: RDD family protein [Mycobacterium sp.]|nr:RDD family protein [Mycobacterium sp.]